MMTMPAAAVGALITGQDGRFTAAHGRHRASAIDGRHFAIAALQERFDADIANGAVTVGARTAICCFMPGKRNDRVFRQHFDL